jgi:hypothetical protein
MTLILRLLRRHISGLQLAGFFITNLVGMAIILVAVQLWRDVRPVVEAPDSFMANDFLILSKKVETGRAFFTDSEIQDIDNQPFIEAVGVFAAARYGVVGGISMMGAGFESYLFFESVPDRFLDVSSDAWAWTEGSRTIPIILPRNYLNLYNFGFAGTQGLPQVSEAVVGSVPMEITIGGGERFEGRIVAFSNRLNTILVPENFLRWSNARFADRPATDPSRVIVEVRNPADESLHAYLTAHNYIVEGDDRAAGRTSYLLRVATGVVGGVGVVIALLSAFVLMLSIFLLLQKNTRKLEDLLLLGYSEAQVSRPYIALTVVLNLLVLACAIPLILWARGRYMPLVAMLGDGLPTVSVWPTLLWGLAAVAVISAMNAMAIRSKVAKLWWG